MLDYRRDLSIANLPFQEAVHGDFIGRIQGHASGLTAAQGIVGQTQTGETQKIGLLKIQAPHGGQIQQAHAAIQALRKAQTVGNRRTHVGLAQLRHYRTVYVLDHGVNHALRMHYHINLVNRH